MSFRRLPLLAFLAAGLTAAADAAPVAFDEVRAIFEGKCLECHNPDKTKGKLLMTSREGFLKGGESGAALIGVDAEKSELVKRLVLPKDHDDIMPPKGGPLPAAEIDVIRRWVAEGAAWPAGVVLAAKDKSKEEAKAELTQKLATLERLEIFPESISLETKRDFHRLVVFATFKDATTRDVTAFADLRIADEKVAKFDGYSVHAVTEAGKTEVVAALGGLTARIPVAVKDGQKDRAVSFRLDVMPVFLRANCNSGGCHGAARGKDGFRLSLFGMDPDGDYIRLTREMIGRRINLAIPEESTMVEKAIGNVPHSGNKLYEADSQYNKTILEWISNGAKDDAPGLAKVTGIEVFPKQIVLEGKDATQQITVRATYSDGTDRDVTSLALFMSNNDPVASIGKDGVVKSGDRGAAFMLARFDVFSVTAQAIVIPKGLVYERPKVAEVNYVDKAVNERLHRLRIVPSETCTDEEFVRRVYIDVIGLYPKPAELTAFLADQRPDKRKQLVEALLQRKEFTELWVMKWAELLQIRSGINQGNNAPPFYKNALLYYNWLADEIGKNRPIDQIVVDLLSANGGTVSVPAVNYYQSELDRLKLSENVAQVFMGMRLQCAQCHNHPFAQIGRKNTDDPQEVIVFNSKGGESQHFLTKKNVKPKFLGGEEPDLKPGDDRRRVMAEWLASPRNPYFARNIANLVWAHFFGVGIVDPVDDVRVSNPPSNPELLDELAAKLTEYNYDVRRLVRDITASAAYQRSSKTNASNADDKLNFARAQVRRVRAEVLLDAISQITETPNKFQGLPLGARAVQIADGAVSNYFLTTFGRSKRESVASTEVKTDPNLSQALHLMNGDAVNDRIRRGQVVEKMVAAGKKDDEIIDELFLRVFGRMPADVERKSVAAAIAADPNNRRLVLEDAFWALMNSKEFYFNH
ncbi:MAG: cell surface protein [Opitutia bacterium AMD-G1]|nr:MAG: cell surface protein [Opitutae bacterium AMD-G1]